MLYLQQKDSVVDCAMLAAIVIHSPVIKSSVPLQVFLPQLLWKNLAEIVTSDTSSNQSIMPDNYLRASYFVVVGGV